MNEIIVKPVFPEARLRIEALDGTLTIPAARQIFKSQIDVDFYNPDLNLNNPGPATPITEFKIFDVVSEGTLLTFFRGVELDPDKMVITQHQAIRFCVMYGNTLSKNLATNFFLSKKDWETKDEDIKNYFVLGIMWRFDGLSILSYPLDFAVPWIKNPNIVHRLIIPKHGKK